MESPQTKLQVLFDAAVCHNKNINWVSRFELGQKLTIFCNCGTHFFHVHNEEEPPETEIVPITSEDDYIFHFHFASREGVRDVQKEFPIWATVLHL